jgi:tetratricopeptide (TPR) repeat protein
MIDSEALPILTGMLAQVRQAVTKAGTPHTSAYLHECVAVLEGQTGRLDEAIRHCDIADSLLRKAPNAWLASGNLLIRASVSALNCRLVDAAKYIDSARHYIVRSGNARASGADSTLGHIYVLTGQFDKALAALRRAIESSQPSRLAALAGLNGLARLYLAVGRLDDCRSILERIHDETLKDPHLSQVYSVRWAAITKARYLLKRGDLVEARLFLDRAREH